MYLWQINPGELLDTMLQREQMSWLWLVSFGMRWSEGST